MRNVYIVLLAGGKGTRLWPLSRENYSKSFIRIGQRIPLIKETIERLKGLVPTKNIIIVVDKKQVSLLRKTVKGIPRKNILVEPFGRSTASAVGLAALNLRKDYLMAVLPTDAFIKGKVRFKSTLKKAFKFALSKDDTIFCIGIKPKMASIGYGYIKLKKRVKNNIFKVDKFVEKPNKLKAKKYLRSGKYLWNAGMFLFKAGTIERAIKRYAPSLSRELSRIKKNKKNIKSAYSRMKDVSIDYQIMEKVKNLYCVVASFEWYDIGSWKSVKELYREFGGKRDKKKNVMFGKTRLLETKNTLVYNASRQEIGVFGMEDAIVVNTDDEILVTKLEEAESVKKMATGVK